MSKTCLVITRSLKQENFLHRSLISATMSESMPVSEQSGEGPSNGGISRSDPSAGTAEQSSEGPGNGGIARSATGKQGTKRKLDQKTLEEKYAAIIEVEKGQKTKTEIAKMFNIPKNTLTGWVKKADTIKEGYAKFGPKRRVMRLGQFDDLETALLKWFSAMRDRNIPLSGPLLLQKAKDFAEQLRITTFKQSTGWLDRFKERHGITFKAVCGEAKSVDTRSTEMTDWTGRLSNILRAYSPSDIYNADETGLFFKLMPDKTLEFKSVQCQGGKRSKERLTVMVCANMSGTDKLPLLVIGKFANPRCFKNLKTLPTQYENNKKAWMTSDIFTSWLKKIDKRFERQGRKVAMIVDNYPAHPRVDSLRATELIFLPPNTTSHTQPMDQGIIKNLKSFYRNQVIMKQLAAAEKKEEFNPNVLDAMRMLKQSWSMVTARTISNCYRHCGFSDEDPDDDIPLARFEDPDDDIPLARFARANSIDMEPYVDVDRDLLTCGDLTDEDIIDDLMMARNTLEAADAEADDGSDDDEPAPAPPTVTQALEACDLLRRFFETVEGSDSSMNALCGINKDLLKTDMRRRCAKQTSIMDFFRK